MSNNEKKIRTEWQNFRRKEVSKNNDEERVKQIQTILKSLFGGGKNG